MLGLLVRAARRKSSRPSRPASRTRRLGLERLEARDCPAPLLGDVSGSGATIPPPPIPPYITFNTGYGPNRTMIIDGVVNDINPGGLTVTFSGTVQGTTTTLSDGSFHVVLTASALGTFQGQTIDRQGLLSNVCQSVVQNQKPVIQNFTAWNEFGEWVIQGSVQDECAPGLTVTFASSIPQINGKTATVDSSGNFSFVYVPPAGANPGGVSATVTDWWNETSDPQYVYIG
jgi:hypothetical protein